MTAVLQSTNFIVRDLVETAALLAEKLQEDNFKSAVESLSRVFNLAEKARGKRMSIQLFENQEKDLAAAIEKVELTSDLAANLDQLFALSPVIDAFFDHTMVMAEDEAVRNNRLAL